MKMKSSVKAFLAFAIIVGALSQASADVPKEKHDPLASALSNSFRERDSDQVSYKSNKAAVRPDDRLAEKQARNELKSIHIEIGDGLAGKGAMARGDGSSF